MEITPADLSNAAELKYIVAATRCTLLMRLFISHLRDDDIEQSLAIAEAAAGARLCPVPHIAARRYKSIAHLTKILHEFRRCAGISEILILAGDAPIPAGTLLSSLDLLRSGAFEKALFRTGIKRLWFGIYPEGHTDISATKLQSALQEKCVYARKTGLAVKFISQMTFTSEPLINWLDTLPAAMPSCVYSSVFATGHKHRLAHLAQLTRTPSARQFLEESTAAIVSYHPQLYRIAAAKRRPGGLHFLSLGKFAETMRFAARLQRGNFRIDEKNLHIVPG